MNKKLQEKINEAFSSVLPITIIVLLLSVFVVPMYIGAIMMFLVGAGLLVVGMGFFSLGVDTSMTLLGEGLGAELTKSKKIWLVVSVSLIMGVVITIAEPDLTVLASQVPAIPSAVLIWTVALGVGIFLVVAILRILFNLNLSQVLIALYAAVIILSFFTPTSFVAVAFDSGGVTTGPITVPFIMALGVGLASVRSDKNSMDDSFGLVAICSIGPIIAVMILGICYNPSDAAHSAVVLPNVNTTTDVVQKFVHELPEYTLEVSRAMAPILVVFFLFQLLTRRYKMRQFLRSIVGFVFTWIGLSLFLTGVNVGFIPVGYLIGSEMGASTFRWALIPLGMLVGYYIVVAEPAVHVLNVQVEEVSNGAIPSSAMKLCLSIGVAVSLGLSMLRVLTGISIYWLLIPGYIIALALTFFVPKIFVGIAFDSGGVASGPLTSTFLLPFTIGACEAVGGSVLTDAFGVVAMVAMTPLIAVQLMGLLYSRRMKQAEALSNVDEYFDEIIPYDESDEEVVDNG